MVQLDTDPEEEYRVRAWREWAVGASPLQAAREGSLGVLGKNGFVPSRIRRMTALKSSMRENFSEIGWYRVYYAPSSVFAVLGVFCFLGAASICDKLPKGIIYNEKRTRKKL